MSQNHSIFKTDAGLQKIVPPKAGRDEYKDAAEPGLYLRVSHKGSKTFYGVVKDKRLNRTRRRKLGHYLPGAGMSLAEARKTVEVARHRAAAMLDPWELVDDESDRSKHTFSAIRKRFMKQHVSQLAESTQAAYQSALHSADLKDWEGRAVASLTRADLQSVIDTIYLRAPTQANRSLAYLRKFFNWCADREVLKELEPIPSARVKPPLRKEGKRKRWLRPEEIKLLWPICDRFGYPFGTCVQLLLLTGQRIGEVSALRWVDIDLSAATWTQRNNKADRIHIVPLSPQALALIAEIPRTSHNSDYVFSTTGKSPISGFGRFKRNLDVALLAGRQTEEFADHWVLHDLRRTGTTLMRKQLRIPQFVCSRILNHAQAGVTGERYDMYDVLDEKTAALNAWGNYLQQLLEGEADNVVQIASAERIV